METFELEEYPAVSHDKHFSAICGNVVMSNEDYIVDVWIEIIKCFDYCAGDRHTPECSEETAEYKNIIIKKITDMNGDNIKIANNLEKEYSDIMYNLLIDKFKE